MGDGGGHARVWVPMSPAHQLTLTHVRLPRSFLAGLVTAFFDIQVSDPLLQSSVSALRMHTFVTQCAMKWPSCQAFAFLGTSGGKKQFLGRALAILPARLEPMSASSTTVPAWKHAYVCVSSISLLYYPS